jgi:hypothetical protein
VNHNKKKAVKAIERWRLRDSDNGRPVGWLRWAKSLGIVHTVLFRFCQNGGNNSATLGADTLHKLAAKAKAAGDNETIMALAEYALGVSISFENLMEEAPSLIAGQHHADGIGDVAAIEVDGPVIMHPDTKSNATGIGKVTATKIG